MFKKLLAKLKQYAYNNAVAVDEVGNTLTGGAPSDTISGRTYVKAQQGDKPAKVLEDVLDDIQPDHCEIAHENDLAGRHKESF